MSEWSSGYRAAVRDIEVLAGVRKLLTPRLGQLLRDLEGDAHVIAHEAGNRLQRRRLATVREAK